MKRILVLCTGNSARSQMAEGLFRHEGKDAYAVESAGTKPSHVRAEAIAVMKEIGIDIWATVRISSAFDGQPFDFVVTVCDNCATTAQSFKRHETHSLELRGPRRRTGE